jgi:hypothetical protein
MLQGSANQQAPTPRPKQTKTTIVVAVHLAKHKNQHSNKTAVEPIGATSHGTGFVNKSLKKKVYNPRAVVRHRHRLNDRFIVSEFII